MSSKRLNTLLVQIYLVRSGGFSGEVAMSTTRSKSKGLYLGLSYLFLLLIVVMTLTAVLYVFRVDTDRGFLIRTSQEVPTTAPDLAETTKSIVLWTSLIKSRFKKMDSCPKKCVVTKDARLQPNADMVLFHAKDTMRGKIFPIPDTHPRNQSWVFVMHESPANTYNKGGVQRFKRYDKMFNMTMTYMASSDISTPYGLYVKRRTPLEQPWTTGNKSLLVLWYVSHCVPHRTKYMLQLRKYLPLDVYGKCGQRDPCHKKKSCVEALVKKYKFYLAFENTICTDYVTEKFWNALKRGMVPIAMGTSVANYEQLAPPNSFLHVDNFTSPRHLAGYISYLDRNDSAYNAYHDWRKDYQVGGTGFWCEACKAAHRTIAQPKQYVMSNYWSTGNLCKSIAKHPVLGRNYEKENKQKTNNKG